MFFGSTEMVDYRLKRSQCLDIKPQKQCVLWDQALFDFDQGIFKKSKFWGQVKQIGMYFPFQWDGLLSRNICEIIIFSYRLPLTNSRAFSCAVKLNPLLSI